MAGEGADIYVAVSRAHIMPGISQIDALMAKGIESRGKAEMMEQITKIGDISKKAQEDINRFAKKVSWTPQATPLACACMLSLYIFTDTSPAFGRLGGRSH